MKKRRKRGQLTEAQILLGKHLEELGFTNIVYEYKFDELRRWKADICAQGPNIWNRTILFECDGGKWHGGHRRGNALEEDYIRQNSAQMYGYKLLRFTNEQILDGRAKAWLEESL